MVTTATGPKISSHQTLASRLGLAQHGRREAAALVHQLAAGQQLGAARDRLVDPLLDPVAVVRGDQGADVGVLVHRVAHDQRLDVRDEAASVKSSAIDSWTRIRWIEMQLWPAWE